MTHEEKQLLLKDLCARLPYGVMIKDTYYGHYGRLVVIGCKFAYFVSKLNSNTLDAQLCHVKPYLRSLSSMTEEELKEFHACHCVYDLHPDFQPMMCNIANELNMFDWLSTHHFDIRGLIPKGLALEAPEGMYKTK